MSVARRQSELPILINRFFAQLEDKFANKTQSTFETSDLLELSGLFGDELVESALQLIDCERLKLCKASNYPRQFVEVEPTYRTGLALKLFPDANFCPCKDFRAEVLLNDNQYTCRHVLATKLAIISGKITVEIVADDLFNFLVQQINEQYSR